MYFSTISSTQIFHISFVHFCVIFSTEWPLDAEVPLEQCLRVYRTAFLLNRLNDAAFGKFLIPVAKSMFITFYINVPAFAIVCYWAGWTSYPSPHWDLYSFLLRQSSSAVLSSCPESTTSPLSSKRTWQRKSKLARTRIMERYRFG